MGASRLAEASDFIALGPEIRQPDRLGRQVGRGDSRGEFTVRRRVGPRDRLGFDCRLRRRFVLGCSTEIRGFCGYAAPWQDHARPSRRRGTPKGRCCRKGPVPRGPRPRGPSTCAKRGANPSSARRSARGRRVPSPSNAQAPRSARIRSKKDSRSSPASALPQPCLDGPASTLEDSCREPLISREPNHPSSLGSPASPGRVSSPAAALGDRELEADI